ncbi:L-threonylcarbamoyladenylate synthase [Halococcoides cellulosivorans]|uniref:L-threonylcarbamoyladenylate synthase n=1 Tax=Halococcoides cellulosivorans TaxID=1679096 RepID=A0A2R4WZ79_9EURY|nr:L-threonylcarbamoyladenylate synthase [Halococcoides cellulosivorans]AWB26834.1 threonylcarbamoyl-AMP synthase [Halococcoides cellulosivorans]
MPSLDAAVSAIERGELVVYPTETVYGLGADALDERAVSSVFEAKGRDRDRPISMAVPDLDSAAEYVHLGGRETAFATAFLPGPVTLVVQKRSVVPDALTGGRDRVGVRIPDHPIARDLLAQTGPLTATSANPSGDRAPTTAAEIDPDIEDAAVVLDGGRGSGAPSTVVDVEQREIHRPGAAADAVREWLQAEE